MANDTEDAEHAKAALRKFAATIARTSARTAAKIGVDFDLDDPRVARWLLLTTFEGMFSPSARSKPQELLKLAAEGQETIPSSRRRRRVKQGRQPLVTWEDLVISAHTDARQDHA